MALKQITRVNIAEKVFEQLRDQILQGTWKEGEKLPSEQELTETLGVSRSSVRQAIRTLADYGMVETRNGTGTYVKRQISGNYMLNIVPIGDLQFEDIVEVLDFLCLIEDSVAAMAVQRCTQEELAELQAIHKRLIAAKDQNDLEALQSTHYLKSLITAEMPMDLERKGEQSYQGKMYVRFLAFSNGDLESLYDHSDGFYRRQLILSVKKKPPNREDDPFLADKLCGEIEGIFLWCLEGLRRLQEKNFRFTESARTKANREDARREADNVLLFLRSEGYIRLKADSAVTSANLYAIYCLWCGDNAYTPRSARTVSMTLKKHADEFGLEHDNHIQNALGKRVNGFWGIEALVAPPVL